MKTNQKSGKELLLYAFLFEAIAISLVTPLAAFIADRPLAAAGVLAVGGAIIALLWNMLYNAMFERLEVRFSWKRTFSVRVLHAIFFEFGLLSITVPLGAWWLEVSLYKSLILNFGMIMFFLPYAFFYNLAYDVIKKKIITKKDKDIEMDSSRIHQNL